MSKSNRRASDNINLTFVNVYSQVFQKTVRGDSVGPLGVTDNAFLAVGKLFCVSSEEYQIRYGQYRAHHPNADSYH